jgi:hypothetical protein
MWRNGFSETRPSIRAVGSPNRLAIQACDDSCTLIANKKTTISNGMMTTLKFIRGNFDGIRCTGPGTGYGEQAKSGDRVIG